MRFREEARSDRNTLGEVLTTFDGGLSATAPISDSEFVPRQPAEGGRELRQVARVLHPVQKLLVLNVPAATMTLVGGQRAAILPNQSPVRSTSIAHAPSDWRMPRTVVSGEYLRACTLLRAPGRSGRGCSSAL